MSNTISISAQIPIDLSEKLTRVSLLEDRSKSFYIKKGLEILLARRLEDIEDYNSVNIEYEKFIISGEKPIPFSDVKKEFNL